MNKKDRAKKIMNMLEDEFPHIEVPLKHNNVYTLLVAVLLSAQSTDKKVNELTPKLFNKASTPERMVELGTEKIYNYIKELGLARTKSKHIFQLSKILVDKFNNQVPNDLKQLKSLPGVGHKTASVVMAQAFMVPTFPVDTHIHRLAQRWGLTSGKNVIVTERDLKSIFPKSSWNKLHLQIIFYGRNFCTARGCDGTVCKICREIFPNRKSPIITKKA